jgi:hypothetical protein
MSTNELSVSGGNTISKINNVKESLALLQQSYKELLVKDVDFGIIPGTQKPSLWKPGAEKLILLFGYTSDTTMEVKELGNGHREYVATTKVYKEGSLVGSGIGSCSTMEKKYRYRSEYNNGKKSQVENQDIADVYNTCLKMASKRSFVDATIKVTMAGMIFTQDLEDMDFSTQEKVINPVQEPKQKTKELFEKVRKAIDSGKSKGEIIANIHKKKALKEITEDDAKSLEQFVEEEFAETTEPVQEEPPV